jgi:methylenetetrahydrofolate reductase (NADPH)
VPAAHLTCVNATREEIDDIAKGYLNAGINHIVALRGDVPDSNGEPYVPMSDGYAYASDLVAGLKAVGDFEISVAGYPEAHPQAPSEAADLDYLKAKVDAGATRIITQFCLDTDNYLRFVDKCLAKNINVPIVPGIPLIGNFTSFKRFAGMCEATIPAWVENLLAGQDDFPTQRAMISAMIATEQCRIINEAGIKNFHFYTLNKPDLAMTVCHILGIRPA